MSRLSALREALGDTVRSVALDDDALHGAPGETVTVVGLNGRIIDIFLADDRKITEEHAVKIVRSYLSRIGVPPERAPVQGEATNAPRGHKPYGSVAWAEHDEAWQAYHREHHQQTALTIASRAGFGYWEMTDLLGHEPTTWTDEQVPRPWSDER